MPENRLRVGAVGTFDVENYGDLLFPIIAQKELAARLGDVEVVAFAYHGKAAGEWPFPVLSVIEVPRVAASLDAMLIGGGYLVRFDKHVAAGYAPTTSEIHHPTGFWLTPAIVCLQHGVPVLWNAPGAHHDALPEWADPLLELAFSQSSYISVRDEPSRAALSRFSGDQPIEVVPDTVFGLAKWLPERPTVEWSRLRDASGLCGPYIVVQTVQGLDRCFDFLRRHADHLRGYRLLSLPIGPVNGDRDELVDADLPGLVRLTTWPPPLMLAELIRHAAAVIGPSYHLAVTALTAGVPVFTPASLSAGKFPSLAEFEAGLHPLPGEPPHGLDWFLAQLGGSGERPVLPGVAAAEKRVAAHWDRVAEVVRGGRTGGAVEVGRFWQSLPGLLEGHAARSEAALAGLASVAELEAERERTAERIPELLRLITLARGEIAARDRRIRQFLESTSWKVAAPVRFIGRMLGR